MHAGEGEHDKEVERDSAHAPGVAVAHRVAVDLGRMQVQKDVGQHAQRPVARRVVMLVAEDRSVDLGLGRIFQTLDLLLGLRRHVGLERLDVFLDARLHPFEQADPLPVLPVPVFFSHLNLFQSRVGAGVLARPVERKLDSFLKSADTLPDR